MQLLLHDLARASANLRDAISELETFVAPDASQLFLQLVEHVERTAHIATELRKEIAKAIVCGSIDEGRAADPPPASK